MSTNSLSDIGFYEDFSNDSVSWNSELVNLEKIGRLSALTYLDLSGNNFTDLEIPAEIGNLTNLQHLDFYDAKVADTIPKEIVLPTKLSYLDLISNKLIGAVPSELSGPTSLEKLMLDSNYLSGTVNCSLYPVLQVSADCLDKVNCTGGCCYIDFYVEGSHATVDC
jgi:Leucine-rich repeat (LRR) protein